MTLFKKAAELHNYLASEQKAGKVLGFAPTMGALHEGHISLINLALKENDRVICSIFVNPTQFNDPADFEKYPITIERDIEMLETAGCDILFLPPVFEIYPAGTALKKTYDLGFIETVLEGKFRPGHFQGVCQVVDRLLEVVAPDNLYMGQKDYQQCMVIRKMMELVGYDKRMKLHVSPTLRESDGLAMSSRNVRLNEEDRKKAPAIFQALSFIKENLKMGELKGLREEATAALIEKGFKPDYIAIADAGSLQAVDDWNGKQKIVALAAAFLGEVRLIDNVILN